CQHSYHTPYSF
nr:immunoglobulin light chain junction region [Macaca mulatta]MOW63214.1 immunoglobulin light chain junction region [Macaca mulatta]MOW64902.1 immunoglobulin light chain junction region [Macaca mulatta]